MGHVEAERLHAGLVDSFAELLPRIDGARISERGGLRVVTCPAIPIPGFSGVWVDGPDSPDAIAQLRRAVEEVRLAGAPCWLEIRAGVTPEFEQAARRLGFSLEDTMPGMVVRPDELRSQLPITVEVTRVQDEPGLIAAARVAAAGFESPPALLAPIYTDLVRTLPGVSIYVAWTGGAAVSTAITWMGNGGVGVFNVATPPEKRGNGYGRAVAERGVRDAFAAGADLAWLQASPLGGSVYRAMGFRPVATYEVLAGPAPE